MLMPKDDFMNLMEHVLPVYIILFLGYALTRLNCLQSVHGPGISRWVSLVAVPMYVFHLLISTDPYQMNLRLIGSDVVQKIVALVLGSLWWRFSPSGNIDGLIVFYNLSTLPNTVLIGEPLMIPLYGKGAKVEKHTEVDIVTIIFLQCLLWYNLNLALLVTRSVLQMTESSHAGNVPNGDLAVLSPGKHWSDVKASPSSGPTVSSNYNTTPFGIHTPRSPASLRSEHEITSQAGALLFGASHDQPHGRIVEGNEGILLQEWEATEGTRSYTSPLYSHAHNVSETSPDFYRKEQSPIGLGPLSFHENQSNGNGMQAEAEVHSSIRVAVEPDHVPRLKVRVPWASIAMKVVDLLKVAPLTYATLGGFVYAILSRRFHWKMPYCIAKAEGLISGGSIGVAIFLLGVTWANSERLVSCGLKRLSFSMLVRFLVGPLVMACVSLATGLRGREFKFAVLQATIPQGVISFVYAKEYNLEVNLFATAVIFQLVVFLPIAICYYFVLEQI